MEVCEQCEHLDICDWWNICTGKCQDCRDSGFNIEQWCHNNCAQKREEQKDFNDMGQRYY